ncbi:SMP-30/gluconolactonase/LRE family protein [Winogradskyella sp. PG-2]|uniref:SMP-30/gluconolactonase/LRE family protein n=1 Tax=Winogradskyella sp. PG-2 TaxID=754409 RepID=UPI0004585DDD|nr:SMP-30/gluconolactonase/LRE family protein [Winogradskyella sp. PG-2]BAO75512.1 gluconolactonase [Winogradskyella sp. PG-2]
MFIGNRIDFTKEFIFTKGIEGPAVDSKGNLYAVNYKEEGTIGVVNSKGKASLFTKLPKGSIGNGIRFDENDNMYVADYTSHNILLIKKGTTKALVYAHDSTMNQPNDLAISPNGILYASDPNWKNETGKLWMAKDQKLHLLEKNMGTTNGIEVSPDGRRLYVNESVQKKVWIYDISLDGSVKNKRLFASFNDFGLDGMRCDEKGNIYVCRYGKGTIAILSPTGVFLKEIRLKGMKPTNITFSNDYKKCYITIADRGCVEVVKLK